MIELTVSSEAISAVENLSAALDRLSDAIASHGRGGVRSAASDSTSREPTQQDERKAAGVPMALVPEPSANADAGVPDEVRDTSKPAPSSGRPPAPMDHIPERRARRAKKSTAAQKTKPARAVIDDGLTLKPTSPWTPEAVAILERDYPAGVSSSEIRRRILAETGVHIPARNVTTKANDRGLRRPDGYIPPEYSEGAQKQQREKYLAARNGQGPTEAAVEAPAVEEQAPEVSAPVEAAPAPEPLSAAPEPSTPVEATPPIEIAPPSPQVRPMRAMPTPPRPALLPDKPLPPVSADFETVRRWGAERGILISYRSEVQKVNDKRIKHGLPPFHVDGYR